MHILQNMLGLFLHSQARKKKEDRLMCNRNQTFTSDSEGSGLGRLKVERLGVWDGDNRAAWVGLGDDEE